MDADNVIIQPRILKEYWEQIEDVIHHLDRAQLQGDVKKS